MEQSFESSHFEVRVSTSPMLRVQEKEEFQKLNDRLAAYIERIKGLKGTNLSLEAEITVLKTDITAAAQKVKDSYDARLAHKRAMIDKTAKEKARQQLLAQNFSTDNSRLRREISDLERRIEEIERKVTSSTQRCNTMEEKYKSTLQERDRLQASLKESGKELDGLKAQLERVKRQLEDETVERVDLHNRIMSLNEEVAFIRKKHSAEMDPLNAAVVILNTSRRQVRDDVVHQTDGKLESAIWELQQQSEQECKQFKQELSAAYEDKLAKLETQSLRDSETVGNLTMELREFTESNASSSKEIEKLRAVAGRLERQWKEKEAELVQLRQDTRTETERLRDELASLRVSYDEKMKAYKDLFDLKIKLDQELERYRQLLDAEEERLRIKFRKRPATTGGTPSPIRARPQQAETHRVKEANISSSATGCVQIINVDPKGKYVQIKNMADQAENIGGFKLVHVVAETGQEDAFVFHARSRLKGNSTTTVWSKLSRHEHQPPTDIVSKQIDMWGVGNETTTKLFTNKGEIATYIQRQQVASAVAYSSTPEGQKHEEASDGPGPSQVALNEEESEGEGEQMQVGTEELYQQEETAPVEKKNRSCVIS